jgi:hypothetical protein
MGITLGWLAVTLAGIAGATPAKSDGPIINYQFRIFEMRGLEWREEAYAKLKPVTRRGVVTVWTAPLDFTKSLPKGSLKSCQMTPAVSVSSQAPAHVTTLKSHSFVTQVAWKGDDAAPQNTTEDVREGLVATVAGRLLDQGTLVQLVIEDTDIRSVHTIRLSAPSQVSKISSKGTASGSTDIVTAVDQVPPGRLVSGVATGCFAQEAQGCCESSCPAFDQAKAAHSREGCKSECPATEHARSKDSDASKARWTSTTRGCDVEDEDDNHDEAASCDAAKTAKGSSCDSGSLPQSPKKFVQIQIPEIAHAGVAGEWLIPRDEFLVVGFGPHTIADQDGKAVVRERLAVISAEDVAGVAAHQGGATELLAPRPPAALRVPQTAIAPPMPIPAIPSRSIPQGIHADGTPAPLPPLPEDEKADHTSSDSSEPLPSPQIKKPRPGPSPSASSCPGPGPDSKPSPAPAADARASKIAFLKEKSLFRQISFFPMALPNLQFLLPLKPISLKLPFNQKLELELLGRIVPDPEGASWASTRQE